MVVILGHNIFCSFLEVSWYLLVAQGKSCKNGYRKVEKQMIRSDECAIECKTDSFLFSFGCGVDYCKCYCITGANADGTCNYYINAFYNLYKYDRVV